MYKLYLSDLSKMPEKERQKAMRELVRLATEPTPNERQEQIDYLHNKIAYYENKYQITSEQFKNNIELVPDREGADRTAWLMLLKLQSSTDNHKPLSREDCTKWQRILESQSEMGFPDF